MNKWWVVFYKQVSASRNKLLTNTSLSAFQLAFLHIHGKRAFKPRWAGVAQRLWNGLPRNDPGFDFPWGHYKNRTSCPSQGTVNGDAVSKWHRCRWDVKHTQPTNQPKLGGGSKVESMCPASLVCSVNGRFTRLIQTERFWKKMFGVRIDVLGHCFVNLHLNCDIHSFKIFSYHRMHT